MIFEITLQANQSVLVTGSFDNWRTFHSMKRTGAVYQSADIDVSLSGDKVNFKFIVDDIWITSDAFDTEVDSQGNVNNVICLSAKSSPVSQIVAIEENVTAGFAHPSTQIVVQGMLEETSELFKASYEKVVENGPRNLMLGGDCLSPVTEESVDCVAAECELAEPIATETKVDESKQEEPAYLATEDSHTTLHTEDEKSTAEFGSDFASQIVHTSKKSKTIRGKLNSWFGGAKRSEVVHCEMNADGEVVESVRVQGVDASERIVESKVSLWSTVLNKLHSTNRLATNAIQQSLTHKGIGKSIVI